MGPHLSLTVRTMMSAADRRLFGLCFYGPTRRPARVVIFSLIFLLNLFHPGAVSGCVCDTLPTVEKAFDEAAAVFSGRYVGSEYRKGIKNEFGDMEAERDPKKAGYEVLIYRFEDTKWWKGEKTGVAILVTDQLRLPDSTEVVSDCDLGFEAGKTYLIYAYGTEKEYGTGACTRTRSIKRAKADIAVLNKLAGRPPSAKLSYLTGAQGSIR